MFLPACIGLNSTKPASLDVSCHAKHVGMYLMVKCILECSRTPGVSETLLGNLTKAPLQVSLSMLLQRTILLIDTKIRSSG